MAEPFEISAKIKTALSRGAPVVALESTVIAHGLPGGKGVEAAQRMAAAVDSEACAPAVIGIIEGKIKIGLTDDEIKALADGTDIDKVSTRDIATTVVAKRTGATTVAATAFLAVNAGISVTATGGIGGVHRGARESWDISADMWEMAKTPALVVCSGAKSVLDLRATLEWLDTHQVAIYGWQTDELPAFYSRQSGLSIPRIDKAEDAAEIYKTRIGLGLRSGMILAVPIPEEAAIDVDESIEKAVEEAGEQGITGPALTPWLLARVQELSGGAAIEANLALLENNAKVAAQLAAELMSTGNSRIGFH